MRNNPDTTQLMALSLFILILAFFIVLNSVSDFREEKVLPVLASLEAAFASELIGAGGLPSVIQQPDDMAIDLFSGSVLDELEVAFRNSFDLMSISRPNDGRMMSLTMTKAAFFQSAARANQVGALDFKEKLSRVLGGADTRGAYVLDVVVESDNPANHSLDEVDRLISGFSRYGIAPSLIAFHIEKGDPALLRFTFVPNTQRAQQ